ncbi:hypothetical protein AV530_009034 [Patagioenas fasciata monilis]|uniref:Uncharacterized protein n=1 Tax=Patagioenas fasciata monilis TaxID=372326 RepID=A0A1V4KQT3_PATFA|nr:hypothetical protein AV530_009034 [Patagioenas fasciata monilis]
MGADRIFEDFGGVRLVFKAMGKMLMVPSSPRIPNEPKNIGIAAGYLAKIKAIPAEEVIEDQLDHAAPGFEGEGTLEEAGCSTTNGCARLLGTGPLNHRKSLRIVGKQPGVLAWTSVPGSWSRLSTSWCEELSAVIKYAAMHER